MTILNERARCYYDPYHLRAGDTFEVWDIAPEKVLATAVGFGYSCGIMANVPGRGAISIQDDPFDPDSRRKAIGWPVEGERADGKDQYYVVRDGIWIGIGG